MVYVNMHMRVCVCMCIQIAPTILCHLPKKKNHLVLPSCQKFKLRDLIDFNKL